MLKYLSQLEHKIGNNVFHFVCDQQSPIHEIKESLCQFLKFVIQAEDSIKAQQEIAKANQALAHSEIKQEPETPKQE